MLDTRKQNEDRGVGDMSAAACSSAEASAEAALERLEAASEDPAAEHSLDACDASGAHERDPCAAAHGEPYAEMADTMLAQLVPGRPAAVLLASPGHGEGKTTTLARLGPILVGRIAGEVLAVDADPDHPSLTAQLASETMVQPPRLGRVHAWLGQIRPTSVPRLSLLSAGGTSAPGPIDWGELLRELVRQYRLVLVDSPSLARPETAQIACCCEGTYLVARLGRTSADSLRRAARWIEQCRGRLLGCIVIG